MRFEQTVGTLKVKDLISHHRNGKLNLNPGFQRNSVWTTKQKRDLVLSLLANMPIPTVFLWKHKEGNKIIFDVIDGKQRSEAILDFVKRGSDLRAKVEPDEDSDWIWKESYRWAWKEIRTEENVIARKFLDYEIPTVTVVGNLEDVERLFIRLNSTGSKLTKQEILNAKFHGNSDLLTTSNALSKEFAEYLHESGVVSNSQAARMKSIELFSELILSAEKGNVLNRKDALDSIMAHKGIKKARLEELKKQVRGVVTYIKKNFPDIKKTRFKKTPDFYALAFAIWRIESEGVVLKSRASAKLAFDLLTRMSLDITNNAVSYKEGKSFKLKSPAREYHLTVLSSSDQFENRKKRVAIIEALIRPLFETKAAKRAFTDEQKQLLWGGKRAVICRHCKKPIHGWDDADADHIKPFSKGGKTVLNNAQLLHKKCNKSLGAKGRD